MPKIVVDRIWIGTDQDDEDDPANWKELSIPAKYEVCPDCEGEGTSSAYLGAFTWDQIDELGDDFREDYFAGRYDRLCETCKGERVVPIPDRENADPEILKMYDEIQDEERQSEQMHRMEMQAEYGPDYMW
jgi:hypothetical protein